MPTDPMHQIQRTLGELTAEVRGMRAAMAEGDRRSSDSRAKLFSLTEDTAKQVADLRSDVRQQGARLDTLEPDVADWRKVKQRGVGIVLLLSAGVAALTGGLKALASWLGLGGG